MNHITFSLELSMKQVYNTGVTFFLQRRGADSFQQQAVCSQHIISLFQEQPNDSSVKQ